MADREAYVQADALIEFWNHAGPGAWFSKNPDFDQALRERFTDAHFAAARCDLDHWMADADASLALVLLLDQFPVRKSVVSGKRLSVSVVRGGRRFRHNTHTATQIQEKKRVYQGP